MLPRYRFAGIGAHVSQTVPLAHHTGPTLAGRERGSQSRLGLASLATLASARLCAVDNPRSPMLPSERIEADMRLRLQGDEWSSGDQLPTLVELAEHYGASRGTVATVLRRLADAGLVVIRPRWGVFKSLLINVFPDNEKRTPVLRPESAV